MRRAEIGLCKGGGGGGEEECERSEKHWLKRVTRGYRGRAGGGQCLAGRTGGKNKGKGVLKN